MYYLPDHTPSSFYDRGIDAQMDSARTKGFGWFYLVAPILIIALVVGSLGWNTARTKTAPVEDPPEILGQSSMSATPVPTVGRTFGDLLKEQRSYSGWIPGVQDGSIILVQPENGSINRITTAENQWYGPISDLAWSPDRSKLAYLTLPAEDAAKLSKDPSAFAKSAGFDDVPTPSAFPFGRITTVDLITKEVHQSSVEVRNRRKSLVWLDGTSLAAVGQTLIKYSIVDHTMSTIAAGGNTTAKEQLQSPLAWDAKQQKLYATKVKEGEDGQAQRLLFAVNLKTNALKDVASLRTGPFVDVSASQGVDIALAADGKRVAVVSPQGLSYITVEDGAVHLLPYRDEYLWMQHSILADAKWLAPDKIAFSSMADDGSKVWGVWYVPTGDVGTLGKGATDGSWDAAGERLALLQPDGETVAVITPDWSDMAKAKRQNLKLSWSEISW